MIKTILKKCRTVCLSRVGEKVNDQVYQARITMLKFALLTSSHDDCRLKSSKANEPMISKAHSSK